LALALLGVFFYMWNEKKEVYFEKSPMIKNMQEYHQTSLKTGKPVTPKQSTTVFSVSPWRSRVTARSPFSTHQFIENLMAALPPVSTGNQHLLIST